MPYEIQEVVRRPWQKRHHFKYDDIASSKRPRIRLLTIKGDSFDRPIDCSLTQHDLEEPGLRYQALSYTWGQGSADRCIRVNGKHCHTQPNLEDALRHLRNIDAPLTLWTDAVCINQYNDQEKTQQVALMGKIFGAATQVVIWLGPVTVSQEQSFAEHAKLAKTRDSSSHASFRKEISQRAYWNRAWIRQEVLLARAARVQWGFKQFSLEHFVKCYSGQLRGDTPSIQSSEDVIIQLHADRTSDYKLKFTLEELLNKYGDAECRDPRDRVYSLLSLATDCQSNHGPSPDYDISTQVLFFALMQFCRPKDPRGFYERMTIALQLNAHEIRQAVLHDNGDHKWSNFSSATKQMYWEFTKRVMYQNTLPYSPRNITSVCTTERSTLLMLDVCMPPGPYDKDELWRIGGSNFLLVFRKHLGETLIGFVHQTWHEFPWVERGSLSRGSYQWINPLRKYGQFIQTNWRLITPHLDVAKTIIDGSEKYMNRPSLAIRLKTLPSVIPDEIKMSCVVMESLHGRVYDDSYDGVHLNMQKVSRYLHDPYKSCDIPLDGVACRRYLRLAYRLELSYVGLLSQSFICGSDPVPSAANTQRWRWTLPPGSMHDTIPSYRIRHV